MSHTHVDPARRTGRTTRAVTSALIAACSGFSVVYVVHNRAMVHYVMALARELCGVVSIPATFRVVTRDLAHNLTSRYDFVAHDHYQGGR